LLRIGLVLTGLYVLYFLVMYSMQRHLFFPGQHRKLRSHEQAFAMGESLWVEHAGARVEVCLLLPYSAALAQSAHPQVTAQASRERRFPLIIYTHGNGELISDWPNILQPYREWNCAVALVEYPGYGRSGGAPSEAAITACLEKAYDMLTARPEIDARRVVCHGRSLGGGAACALARRREVAALILESTFCSLPDMAARYGLPGGMCCDTFDNLATVKEWNKPLMVMHGKQDGVVPFSQGECLATAAPQTRFVVWPDRGHNGDPPNVTGAWREIHDFLKTANLLAAVE
jgi:hypothetical protein